MGWTDLIKLGSKAKPDPRLRWFGKLPTYPDYYSSQTDESWAVEFNDWVLKGFEIYQSRTGRSEQGRERLPDSGCVIRLPKSQMTVFASVLDFGGDMRGRPFPICFYVAVPTAQLPGPSSHAFAGVSQAVRDLLALKREVARFVNSPGRFEDHFGDRTISLDGVEPAAADESWIGSGKSVTLNEWFRGACDNLKVQDRDQWLRLTMARGADIASLDGKSFEPTFSFPLAKGVAFDAQVAGWLHWLERRMNTRRRQLSLVVTGDLASEAGRLNVIARALVPDDFLLLTVAASMLPYLDDLASAEPRADGDDSTVSTPFGTEATWLDFVQGDAAPT